MTLTPDPAAPPISPPIVALTGSIGSGKTAVAQILASRGATIIDADVLAREVVRPGSLALQEIANTFGPQFVRSDGELDRKALGEFVFDDVRRRKALEQITHPKIRALFLEKLRSLSANSKLTVYVVPLLFESGYTYPEMNAIVVVTAPEEVCIERILKRDGGSRKLAEQKFRSQMSPAEKAGRADFLIENSGSQQQLTASVTQLLPALLKVSGKKPKSAP
jgi:dephospho-CoA kinase